MRDEDFNGLEPGCKIVAAMSGGVDSSVAAALLLEAGFEVIGVMMQIYPKDLPLCTPADGGCCSVDAADDARRVADRLGIPFYTMNFEEVFKREVIDYFADAYGAGKTPNPCIVCNHRVKFAALSMKAEALGARAVATGHYVRRKRHSTGRYLLYRGTDRRKDQSYVLYGLTQQQLERAVFPLGGLTKPEVRELARRWSFETAEKAESQEICFIPDNDYGRFLRDYRPETVRRPGHIVDLSGKILGEHPGVAFYTVGQRKGLGIAADRPLYIVRLDPDSNQVVVGYAEDCLAKEFFVSDLNWIIDDEVPVEQRVMVKIRYAAPPVEATIYGESHGVRVVFTEPQRAVTPGQAAVFYHDDLVLGGGTIQ